MAEPHIWARLPLAWVPALTPARGAPASAVGTVCSGPRLLQLRARPREGVAGGRERLPGGCGFRRRASVPAVKPPEGQTLQAWPTVTWRPVQGHAASCPRPHGATATATCSPSTATRCPSAPSKVTRPGAAPTRRVTQSLKGGDDRHLLSLLKWQLPEQTLLPEESQEASQRPAPATGPWDRRPLDSAAVAGGKPGPRGGQGNKCGHGVRAALQRGDPAALQVSRGVRRHFYKENEGCQGRRGRSPP